jgi:hypothetical protein
MSCASSAQPSRLLGDHSQVGDYTIRGGTGRAASADRRDPNTEKSQRVTKAFLQMKKFDIEALKRADEGRD